MNKLIINFAPTGMIPTKDMSPFVPISPEEIIEDVLQANDIGITLVHLHARDEDGLPTYKVEEYDKIISKIRQYAPELVICVSLSGRNFNVFEKRSEVLELLPDLGSLTLNSLNFPKSASVNDPEMIYKLALKMKELHVKPELEVFDIGMINYAHYLIKKEIIVPPFYFNIISGNISGIQADFDQIGMSIKMLPDKSYWAIGGIGEQQLKASFFGIAGGGGVRIGLEDNLYFNRDKTKKATNKQLLERVCHLAEIMETDIMKPQEFGALGFYNSLIRR